MIQVTDIQLSNELDQYSYKGEENTDPKVLSRLSKINIFVGPNNSGKSRLIRNLSAQEALVFRPNISFEELNAIVHGFRTDIAAVFQGNVKDAGGIGQKAGNIQPLSFVREKADFIKPIRDVIEQTANQTTNGMQVVGTISTHKFDVIRQQLNAIGLKYLPRLKTIPPEVGAYSSYEKYYIPSIRTLRHLDSDQDASDVLKNITMDSYFKGANAPTIFTGFTMRAEVEQMRLGERKQRRALEDFENYLSQSFFENQDIELLVRKDIKPLYIKIGEEEYPIFGLGDGIQMVIILTFLLFKFRDTQKLLFIEEPELFLHPGMQRMVINQFLSTENTQFFIATHSNHLLDMTLDSDNISIFTIRKQLHKGEADTYHAKFEIENVSHGNRQTLDLLGTRNSSVFLTNCTIWVEGITDRRYLSHYLQLYVNHLRSKPTAEVDKIADPKEDLHFSFMEYSGSNITHWSFLKESPDAILVDRLCGRLFLITDQDNATGKKGERLDELENLLKERYYCLKAREIENLLSPEIIKLVVTEYEGTSDKINAFTYDQYKSECLGQFIENKVLSEKKRKGPYKSDSGSIKDKVVFCEKALKHIKTFTDLSKEAQILTQKLFEFIKTNNP